MAANAAAIANAVKASGILVRLEPQDFQNVLRRVERALIVHAEGGLLSTSYQYLTSYKGLAFYTKSKTRLMLPHDAEVVRARSIWVPQ